MLCTKSFLSNDDNHFVCLWFAFFFLSAWILWSHKNFNWQTQIVFAFFRFCFWFFFYLNEFWTKKIHFSRRLAWMMILTFFSHSVQHLPNTIKFLLTFYFILKAAVIVDISVAIIIDIQSTELSEVSRHNRNSNAFQM